MKVLKSKKLLGLLFAFLLTFSCSMPGTEDEKKNKDTTAPGVPVVSSENENVKYVEGLEITWTWAAADANDAAKYRYQLNAEDDAKWTETTEKEYKLSEVTDNTAYILYVQTADNAGNWSASGSFKVTVGTVVVNPVPAAPVVSAEVAEVEYAEGLIIKWTWTSDAADFQFQLDDGEIQTTTSKEFEYAVTETTAKDYTLIVWALNGDLKSEASTPVVIKVTEKPAAPVQN